MYPKTTKGPGVRLALLAAWLGYAAWLGFAGRASTAEAVGFGLVGVVVILAWHAYDAWWNRPLPTTEEDPAETTNETNDEPPPQPPSALDDLKFPIAMAAALVLAMVLLGFPGGGLGAGLVAIAALGLIGWLALNRAIG